MPPVAAQANLLAAARLLGLLPYPNWELVARDIPLPHLPDGSTLATTTRAPSRAT